MCCTSAKNLFRLVMIGGLILFGGSVRLFADESAEKKASEPTAEAASDVVHSSADEHSHDEKSSDSAHAEPGHEGGHDTGVPLKWKADLAFFFTGDVPVVCLRAWQICMGSDDQRPGQPRSRNPEGHQ